MNKLTLGMMCALLTLTACNEDLRPDSPAVSADGTVQQQPQPQAQQDNSLLYGAGGLAAGYLLGKSGNNNTGGGTINHAPTTINRTTIVKQTIIQAPKPSTSPRSYSPPRPSYSSPRRSSSFSSSSRRR
jgi:hypothetical protein